MEEEEKIVKRFKHRVNVLFLVFIILAVSNQIYEHAKICDTYVHEKGLVCKLIEKYNPSN